MLYWWGALTVALAVVYLVTYTLIRTSGDGRPWFRRLVHPNGTGPGDKQE
jgi:hypothetical protein